MKYFKYLMLAIFSVIFTPFFMGGPFAKTLHRQAGPLVMLGLLFFLTAPVMFAVFPIGSYVFALFLLIFIQAEFEKRGYRFWKTVVLAFAAATLFWVVSTQVWMLSIGLTWASLFDQAVEHFLKQIQTLPNFSQVKMTKEMFIQQIPGVFFSIFILFLGFGIGLERKTHHLFRFHYERYASQMRPLEFRLPDPVLWVMLMSALFSMFDQVPIIQILAQNLVALGFAAYFFQGLAILEVFLIFIRAHPFLKFFIYFALVGQLLLVISAIGFVDFWLDLRKKMRKSLQKNQNWS